MLDFVKVSTKVKNRTTEVYPKFMVRKTSDLMIRGGDFYAVWNEYTGLWSTDEQDLIDLVDKDIDQFLDEHKSLASSDISYMWDASCGSIDSWHKYCQKQTRDNYHALDETLIFSNSPTKKEQYASKRLPYPLEEGDYSAWDKLIGTLYSEDERHKIEWAIGAIVCGASKTLQKFMVLYGSAGTGKSTIINVIQKLFDGYYCVFEAKALGSSNNAFALEAFKTNPLVAIEHDSDLSRIEDNTRLNSLVSHEYMTVNEKFKSTYTNKFNAFLIIGTNKPVKITDGKSGLLRRLIDVKPSGNKLDYTEYKDCVNKIDFELGAIAYHCQSVYLSDPEYYDNYIPYAMMSATNDFFNFIIDSYSVFKRADEVSLKVAYEMYKQYTDDANVPYPYPLRTFKEELKNYFREFDERIDGDSRIKNIYRGFKTDIFEKEERNEKHEQSQRETGWLEFRDDIESVFDRVAADWPAQYSSESGTPRRSWDRVTRTLSDLDSRKLHYVKIPESQITNIVIDFDLKDESGNKSFEKNLEAANKWPPTYAELSKSEAGIHLHYIYTGDVSQLSRIYDEDIEVKVFTGNSSLRRKLTKCNDLSINPISSGLPLKEVKKMVDMEVVQTAKGLRTTIKQCLNKEHHGATTPEVCFIKKILDEAYESGMTYDLSDMKGAVIAFANGSTNQSAKCLKMVQEIHFKSDDISLPTAIDESDKPIVVYDVEVFPNLFVLNWMYRHGNTVVRMINPTPAQIEEWTVNYRIAGFNCRRYDNHIIWARMLGFTNEQLYNLSQRIISGDRNAFFGPAYNLSYTDIYDFASAGNKKSLKKLEIEMGIHHQELGLPWDQPVPEELWTKVAEYCDNDVIATDKAWDYLDADWSARLILADLAELSENATTNALTTKIIFEGDKEPQKQFNYRDLSKPVLDMDEETYNFLANACPKMMEKTHGEAGSYLPYFPGYKYEYGKSTYKDVEVGEGGRVFAQPGMYGNVALLDIASMHPHSTIAECLFGVKYTTAYRDIVEGRVSIKHEAWDEVNNMLNGKLTKHIQKVKDGEMTSKALANALKTAINSVYGLTAAGFDNPFRDSRNKDNIVAKRGALFMVDLQEEVEKRGFKVAHIKTDSIKIPDATTDIINFVMEFGERYGYTFEHEATYDRMCLVNDAVYIAKYKDPDECMAMYGYVPDDNKKHKDDPWTATGKQFAVPYVFKTLFSKEKVEFSDLCETFSVSKGDLYLDINETLPDVTEFEKELNKLETKYRKGTLSDTTFEPEYNRLKEEISKGHNLIFVGRVGQFTPILPGNNAGVLYRVNEGKNYAASGSTGFRWLESEKVKELGKEDLVDYGFYNKLVDDAVEVISKHCDFEWFTSDEPYIPPEPTPGFMHIPDWAPEPEIPFY